MPWYGKATEWCGYQMVKKNLVNMFTHFEWIYDRPSIYWLSRSCINQTSNHISRFTLKQSSTHTIL